ncbi:MAG: hypothetical protein Q3962_06555, partial [Corynebacterium sp.]|nr:hypothetical protein [Corynebacterium sp.]
SDGSKPTDSNNPGGSTEPTSNPTGGNNPGGSTAPSTGSNPAGGNNPGGSTEPSSNPTDGNNPTGGSNPTSGNNPGGSTAPSTGSNPSEGSNPTSGATTTTPNATTDLSGDKVEAAAQISALPNLTDAEKKNYRDRVAGATTAEEIVSIVREAAKRSVDANPNLTDAQRQEAKRNIDNATDVDTIAAYADPQNKYNSDLTTPATTTAKPSGSAKVPFWAWILGVLGLTGGVLGWGYVHDADFRAVVDTAIANFQHAVDNALGIRR